MVPRSTSLRVDGTLGWHLYGTDLSLQAQEHGLRVVVVDAPVPPQLPHRPSPSKYRDSERVLAGRKWETLLPIHTNLSSIGSWLIDGPDAAGEPAGTDAAVSATPRADGTDQAAVADLVTRLRREQTALNVELEQDAPPGGVDAGEPVLAGPAGLRGGA